MNANISFLDLFCSCFKHRCNFFFLFPVGFLILCNSQRLYVLKFRDRPYCCSKRYTFIHALIRNILICTLGQKISEVWNYLKFIANDQFIIFVAFVFCTHWLEEVELVGVSQNLRILHCVAGQRRTKELLSNIWKTSLHYKNVKNTSVADCARNFIEKKKEF